jgi:cytochrome b6-f complex iron-sulfur subunit
MKTSRREFIKKAGYVTACTCAGFGMKGCSMFSGVSATPEIFPDALHVENGNLIIDLNQAGSLKEPGGSGKLTIVDPESGEKIKIIVIQPGEGEYKAFADRCTHGGRELNYVHDKKQLKCSSFGQSTFTLQGEVVKGPAKEPVDIYDLQVAGNNITIIFQA